ncbi:peptidoglycan-binding domain-containing protein [Kamptonema formosum]|uniref:peptidoglycan-binding domain-containing protein n=1 Tax=Kamptonema formosum TaxID=331992 RepID=UPI00350F370A
MQRLLGEQKPSLNTVKNVGVFCPTAGAPVREFQPKAYLPADGFFGYKTWAKLLSCHFESPLKAKGKLC